MKIRIATINDLRSIQQLNHLLFEKEVIDYDQTLNLDWTFSKVGEEYYKKKILEPESIAVVTEDHGVIIGYLVGSEQQAPKYRKLKKVALLENMFVSENKRNRGVGRLLVESFLGWCRDRGIAKVQVAAFSGNVEAIKFYKTHGFHNYETTLEAEIA